MPGAVMAYHAGRGSGYTGAMTPDDQPQPPVPPADPARARDTGALQPLPSAPGATSDLSHALLRRGKLPEPPPKPETPVEPPAEPPEA